MTCACEQDKDGRVIGLCGAHAEFERRIADGIRLRNISFTPRAVPPKYDNVWFVGRPHVVCWIRKDGAIVRMIELFLEGR